MQRLGEDGEEADVNLPGEGNPVSVRGAVDTTANTLRLTTPMRSFGVSHAVPRSRDRLGGWFIGAWKAAGLDGGGTGVPPGAENVVSDRLVQVGAAPCARIPPA